jgi:hypothetical protein
MTTGGNEQGGILGRVEEDRREWFPPAIEKVIEGEIERKNESPGRSFSCCISDIKDVDILRKAAKLILFSPFS